MRPNISVFMFGTYSQCLCSLKSEMLQGVGPLKNLEYVLESVDSYRLGKVCKK